jgi:hypothetical protein
MHPEPLSPEAVARLASYLADHWQTPEQYIAGLFVTRDVVLLGEEHTVRYNLELAQALIPVLYETGVFNFGMEFGAVEDQVALDALVTGERYDEDTARRLMFNYNSGRAFREYMDIYRAAWAFNRTLPRAARPFRVLNLSYRYDWADAPVVRTPVNARRIYHRGPMDAFRAGVVQREVLDQGEKILILTGTPHAFTRYRIPLYDFNAPDFVRFEERNLGQLLPKLASARVACVLLHQAFHSKQHGDAQRVHPAGGAIDQVLEAFTNRRVGFDLVGSPLGDLTDDSFYATGYEDFRLSQLADGYIYDRPFAEFESCTLDEAFLSEANWLEAQRQFPDPDWHVQPASLDEYWALIRALADVPARYAALGR